MPRRSPRFLVADSALLATLNDDLLGHALQLLAPTALARTARVCKRLRGLAADERKRRVKTHGGAAIEAWLGGAKNVQRIAVRTAFGINTVRAYPDGSRLVGVGSAASAKEVTLYDPNASVLRVLTGPSANVMCVATDGVHTVCGDDSGGLFAWTAEGEPVGALPKEHSSAVLGLALRGDLLVSGSYDRTAKLWSLGARACTATLREHTGTVYAVAATGEAIATASRDRTARIWPLDGGASRHTLSHPDEVNAVAMAGDRLVTACDDKVIRVFAVATGRPTRELRGHTRAVLALALSGAMVVSGAGFGQVKVWALADEAEAECVATLQHGEEYVCGVVAGPDFVASQGYGDTSLVVWRPA